MFPLLLLLAVAADSPNASQWPPQMRGVGDPAASDNANSHFAHDILTSLVL